jgi:hypothetical protein
VLFESGDGINWSLADKPLVLTRNVHWLGWTHPGNDSPRKTATLLRKRPAACSSSSPSNPTADSHDAIQHHLAVDMKA